MVINVYFTEIMGNYLISMEGAENSFLTSIFINPRYVPVFLSYIVNNLVICFLKNVFIFFFFSGYPLYIPSLIFVVCMHVTDVQKLHRA